ncbi:MAG: hypothetical protein KIT17_17295 [Rubrivivax sp.]|nr:hypothetical protein [Rubrivivax sp.]
MNTALLLLVVVFAALMALWPVAWLAALARHALARRWRQVGQVALLLPLWTIAASIGAVKLPPLFAARNAAELSPNVVVAATSIGVAACFAVVAWLLLARGFGRRTPRRPSASELAG